MGKSSPALILLIYLILLQAETDRRGQELMRGLQA